MKTRHVSTVTQRLSLEFGFASELGAAGLTEAIVEALEKGGVLEEAGIVYIRAEAPGEQLVAVEIWAPEPEAPPAEPPELPGGPATVLPASTRPPLVIEEEPNV